MHLKSAESKQNKEKQQRRLKLSKYFSRGAFRNFEKNC